MAVSGALRQLLRLRELEEEQSRLALELELGELRRLEQALEASAQWDRRGRGLVDASARSGALTDRLSGLEESRAAGRLKSALTPRIAEAEREVAALREEFLARRVERRQAETLIEESEARDAVEAARRHQQALDDWHRSRRRREADKLEPVSVRDRQLGTAESSVREER